MLRIFLITMGLLSSLLMGTAQASSVDVGKVMYASGDVWVERGDEKKSIDSGFALLASDYVITGERGRVKLVMKDGSKVYLGAKSRLGLSKYTMHGKNLFQASFNMVWGKARFFVNKLVSRDASFRIRTSTAVLGVRGTSIFVQVPKDGSYVSYTLMTGFADVYPLDKDGNRLKGQRVLAGQTIIVHADGSITIRKATKEEMGSGAAKDPAALAAQAAAGNTAESGSGGVSPSGNRSGTPTVIQNQNGTTPTKPTPTPTQQFMLCNGVPCY